MPYAFAGYPSEWIGTLERLAALDPVLVVPGHGEVLRGKGYIERVAALLRDVREQVNDLLETNGGGSRSRRCRRRSTSARRGASSPATMPTTASSSTPRWPA